MRQLLKDTYEKYVEENYGRLWDRLNDKTEGDCFCLTWSSSYIFRTGGVLWAVDPYFGAGDVLKNNGEKIREFYTKVKFILISHNHRDHFDPQFARLIGDLDVQWIIPEFMEKQGEDWGIKDVLFVNMADNISKGEITIDILQGRHWDRDNPNTGTDALCYFVKTPKGSIFLPGDIRDYTIGKIKLPQRPDVIISHVWLGRGNALTGNWDDYADEFSRFIGEFNPGSIYLTHLYETKRPLQDMWTHTHCGVVMDYLKFYMPETPVFIPGLFHKNILQGVESLEG